MRLSLPAILAAVCLALVAFVGWLMGWDWWQDRRDESAEDLGRKE